MDSVRGRVAKNSDGEVVFNSRREWRTKDGSKVDVRKPKESRIGATTEKSWTAQGATRAT